MLCAHCGLPVTAGQQVFGLVPDTSVLHPTEPDLDGVRQLIACCKEHLNLVRCVYMSRPFVKEELWAAKIARVLRAHPAGVSEEQLTEESGLSIIQIEHTLAWQTTQFLRDQAEEI